MKRCNKCKIEKDEADFYTDNTRKDRLRSFCKLCSSRCHKEYYKIHSKQMIEYSTLYKKLNYGRATAQQKIGMQRWLNKHSKEELRILKKKYHDKEKVNITDSYLSIVFNMPVNDLREYPELIEAKRLQLLIKRELKNQC